MPPVPSSNPAQASPPSFSGAGILNGGDLTLHNTIVANSVTGGIENSGDCFNYEGTVEGRYSLMEDPDAACGLTDGTDGNMVGEDPALGPLADNGGPTRTCALPEGSPAIDAGSNALVPDNVTTDQRGEGFDRIENGTVDMGAYEVQLFFTVTYEGNGRTGGTPPVDEKEYEPGEEVIVEGPGDLVKDGFVFDSWNTHPGGDGIRYLPGDTLEITDSGVALYAQWVPVYQVAYKGNGHTDGTAPVDDKEYEPGEEVIVEGPGDLVKDGFVFDSWNTRADGLGASYFSGDTFEMPEEDVMLYARWIFEKCLSPVQATPLYTSEDGSHSVRAGLEAFMGAFHIRAQPGGDPDSALLELPPEAMDACPPPGFYEWTVYDLTAEKLIVRDENGNVLTGGEGTDQEAGILSKNGYSLCFSPIEAPAVYYAEARCTSSDLVYGMPVLVLGPSVYIPE